MWTPYKKQEKPELMIVVIALIVWAGLVLHSPLGPFTHNSGTDAVPSETDESVVAYNPNNLRRVPASSSESSVLWQERGVLLSSHALLPTFTLGELPSALGSGVKPGSAETILGRIELTPWAEEMPPVQDGPKLAFIIDDWGHRWEAAEGFLQLEVPMTYAVLPFLVNTGEHARRAAEAGFEVILHLPMEPSGSISPGEGAILTALSEDTIRSRVSAALAAVPQAVGVNNHMGSRATEDARVMRTVLEELQSQGLFFVDSHTSARTVAPQVASQLGVPFAQNKVFIDNENDVDYVKQRIWLAVEMAESAGSAVAIGHVKTATLQALQELIPQLRERGIKLVTASNLLTQARPGTGSLPDSQGERGQARVDQVEKKERRE